MEMEVQVSAEPQWLNFSLAYLVVNHLSGPFLWLKDGPWLPENLSYLLLVPENHV